MTTFAGPIFDSDSHVVEKDFDFFKELLPKQYQADWLPAKREGHDGYGFYIGETRVKNHEFDPKGLMPPPGKLKEWLRAVKNGADTVEGWILPTLDMINRDARMQKLDEFGVEAALVFPGEFISSLGYYEPGLAGHAVLHAYNEWLHDTWGFAHQNRLHAVPILALWDDAAALAETEWLLERGVRAVVMYMDPAQGKSLADPHFDPVWSRLNEAGVLVTFHVSEATFLHPVVKAWGETPLQSRRLGQTAWQWHFCYSELPVQMTLANIIYHNFFARFPNIRIASVENGAAWLPHFLKKMDVSRGIAKNGFWPCGQLKERPSKIFKEHCYVVAYPEDDVKAIVDEIGTAQCILMGSDYPHAEGVETPRMFVEEAMPEATVAEVQAIMYDNGRRMMPAAA